MSAENTAQRLPIIAVFGSGDPDHPNPQLAYGAGRRVARAGAHLLTGGGRGVMADASRGFIEFPGRSGLTVGILPGKPGHPEARDGYPNPWVELPILTHLAAEGGPESPSSRNWINVLTAEKILALPGRGGTLAELRLAHQLGKPVLVLYPSPDRPEEAAFRSQVEALQLPTVLIPHPEVEEHPAWKQVDAFLAG